MEKNRKMECQYLPPAGWTNKKFHPGDPAETKLFFFWPDAFFIVEILPQYVLNVFVQKFL